ncbi:hypothetical protein CAEBREN_30399, partial [Caenorhabditis brenneri]
MTNLEITGVFIENVGVLTPGTFKFDIDSFSFKGDRGKKSVKVQTHDIDEVRFQKLGNKPGIRFALLDGGAHRFGGFKDT